MAPGTRRNALPAQAVTPLALLTVGSNEFWPKPIPFRPARSLNSNLKLHDGVTPGTHSMLQKSPPLRSQGIAALAKCPEDGFVGQLTVGVVHDFNNSHGHRGLSKSWRAVWIGGPATIAGLIAELPPACQPDLESARLRTRPAIAASRRRRQCLRADAGPFAAAPAWANTSRIDALRATRRLAGAVDPIRFMNGYSQSCGHRARRDAAGWQLTFRDENAVPGKSCVNAEDRSACKPRSWSRSNSSGCAAHSISIVRDFIRQIQMACKFAKNQSGDVSQCFACSGGVKASFSAC